MDSRAIFRMDIGFCIGVILWALLKNYLRSRSFRLTNNCFTMADLSLGL